MQPFLVMVLILKMQGVQRWWVIEDPMSLENGNKSQALSSYLPGLFAAEYGFNEWREEKGTW